MSTQVRQRYRVFPGWWVVAGAFITSGISSVVGIHAIGLLFKPMSESLQWSRGAMSLAFSLRSVASALVAPIMGPKIDAWGPRPFMVVGGVVGGVTIALLSGVTELWQFYLLYGVINGVASMAGGMLVTSTTVSKWFVRRRGRAIALADLGQSVGAVLLVPVVALLISLLDWQGTWVVLGVLTTGIILSAAFMMRSQPEDYGLQPDGMPVNDPAPGVTVESTRSVPTLEAEWTRGQAIRTPAFWLMLLAFSASGMGFMAIGLHQIPHITDRGFSQAEAATALTVWAACAGLSRVSSGFLAERIQLRYLMVTTMLGSAAGVGLLLWLPNLSVLYLFAVVYGLFRGPYTVIANLVWADYFGRRHLGAIRGMIMPFSVVSNAGGPLLAGFLFDSQRNYNLAFQLFLGGYLLAALLAYLAKPPVHRASMAVQA